MNLPFGVKMQEYVIELGLGVIKLVEMLLRNVKESLPSIEMMEMWGRVYIGMLFLIFF
jgi:hypothetical protein